MKTKQHCASHIETEGRQKADRRQTDKDSRTFTTCQGLAYQMHKLLCERRELVLSSKNALASRVRKAKRAVQAHL